MRLSAPVKTRQEERVFELEGGRTLEQVIETPEEVVISFFVLKTMCWRILRLSSTMKPRNRQFSRMHCTSNLICILLAPIDTYISVYLLS